MYFTAYAYFVCVLKVWLLYEKKHEKGSFKIFHNVCLDGLGQKHTSLNRSVSDFPDNRNINLLVVVPLCFRYQEISVRIFSLTHLCRGHMFQSFHASAVTIE
jgi:hypothetical protein